MFLKALSLILKTTSRRFSNAIANSFTQKLLLFNICMTSLLNFDRVGLNEFKVLLSFFGPFLLFSPHLGSSFRRIVGSMIPYWLPVQAKVLIQRKRLYHYGSNLISPDELKEGKLVFVQFAETRIRYGFRRILIPLR